MPQPVRAEGKTRAAGEPPAGDTDVPAQLKRSRADKPPFTLADIKRAIPPHCFKRSVVRSSTYLLRNLAAAAVLLYLALAVLPAFPGPLRVVAWPVYWVAQGCALGGAWVVAHECGHHAFSEHALLDDAVGFAVHTALLVPYFSWKHSHRRHHANSGSLDRDEVFVPRRKSELSSYTHRVQGSAAGRLAHLFLQLTLGWPLYLACNAAGRPYPRFASHYDPYSPIFSGSQERAQVLLSDAGVLAVSLALWRLAAALGSWTVARLYGVPLLVVNAWLVLVTYLQHTDPAVPRYGGREWDWLRGALATVDRDYGAVLNSAFHNITDTHVVHHLFPSMPHYHAAEATRAIRPVLGENYRFDATPVAWAASRVAKDCVYVEADGHREGVFWYGNKF
ncbi:hypothetical protein U9M48_028664 [Paspalum notatum var. saurae]|uniref:Uncharacterized protein n=1 Tax=Paspalum notatum var. saurae TaxID=547442 RepID=A0AAQ3TX51_PASNO